VKLPESTTGKTEKEALESESSLAMGESSGRTILTGGGHRNLSAVLVSGRLGWKRHPLEAREDDRKIRQDCRLGGGGDKIYRGQEG